MTAFLPRMVRRALCVTFFFYVADDVASAQATAPKPVFERATGATYDFGGVVRDYIDAITTNWLLKMPDTNPAILEMFATRDQQPQRSLLPWSGEFAGKYLTGAVQIQRLTGNP